MSVQLPAPAETRAIFVGIERYPNLGGGFDVPGAAAAAINFARWAAQQGVSTTHMELWLAPKEGDPAQMCAEAGLDGASVITFSWEKFRARMSAPSERFVGGRFLIVYYCGHGAVFGEVSDQYLVLPEATQSQFRSFELENWCELFKCFGWERFGHQLWVVDACRNQWSASLKPVSDGWSIVLPSAVRRCLLLSCAKGQTAAATSQYGPRFTQHLLMTLQDTVDGTWPDFTRAATATAARLGMDGLARQRPTMHVENWDGMPLVGPGLVGPALADLLALIPWPSQQFLTYAKRALSVVPSATSLPNSVGEVLTYLDNLPNVNGIPPLFDFLERVARASHCAELERWLDVRLSVQQRVELDTRLAAGPVQARLSLWYREDAAQPCVEGSLDILDAGSSRARPWSGRNAKPISDGILKVIGEWLNEAYDHIGNHGLELEVELFLPTSLLATTEFDIAIVPVAQNDEIRLGEDCSAVLRSTDRYKARGKFNRLRKHAPIILARLKAPGDRPLRWTKPHENAGQWKPDFFSDGSAGPIWLGFDLALAGLGPLDSALTEGLPAVVWCRASPEAGGNEKFMASLQSLLKSSIEQLPKALIEWRMRQSEPAGTKLALLLDDPERLPPMWSTWTQPGE